MAITNSLTGIDTSDATATAAQILSGYTAYAQGQKVTGNYAAPVVPEIYLFIIKPSDAQLLMYQHNSSTNQMELLAWKSTTSSSLYQTLYGTFQYSMPYDSTNTTAEVKDTSNKTKFFDIKPSTVDARTSISASYNYGKAMWNAYGIFNTFCIGIRTP